MYCEGEDVFIKEKRNKSGIKRIAQRPKAPTTVGEISTYTYKMSERRKAWREKEQREKEKGKTKTQTKSLG